jgi:hypothetical protein
MDKVLDITMFSSHLFWGVNRQELDVEVHAAFIIKRVLEYGALSDWKLIRDYYSTPVIAEEAKKFRELDELNHRLTDYTDFFGSVVKPCGMKLYLS